MESTRLAALDGLRGIAAFGVALHHVFYHYAPLPAIAPLINALADWFWHSGWMLVDLFFVLSGYVFAHVYLGGGDGLRAIKGQRAFWVARLARLWPLHVAMLIVCAVLLPDYPGNTATAFIGHLFMLQGFISPVAHTYNFASWSLTMELVCYGLFAAAAIGGARRVEQMALVTVALSLCYFILLAGPGGPWVGDALWRGLLGFFLGQLMWSGRDRLARVPSAVLVLLVMAGFWLERGSYSPILPLALLAWPAALLLALRGRMLAARPLVWLGDRSYAVYLVNLPLILITAQLLDPAGLNLASLLVVQTSLLAGVLVLSDLLYRGLEMPARRKVRQWLSPPPAEKASAALA